MPEPTTLAYGTWPSPLSPRDLAAGALRLACPRFAPDGSVLWVEGRPADKGRSVLVWADGNNQRTDLVPAPFSVRSRVHEYGGGAYAVSGEAAYFVNDADQAIYRVPLLRVPLLASGGAPAVGHPGEAPPPERLTVSDPDLRFGDLTVDAARNRLLAVCEDHRGPGPTPDNRLIAIDFETGAITVLVEGADFFASPTPNPDGRQLAWLSWNRPHMPWDAAALYLADLDQRGRPVGARLVAGDAAASAQQPAFAPDGTLAFVYEASGFWNLWWVREGKPRPAFPIAAEWGVPLWQLGTRTWGFLGADGRQVVAASIAEGVAQLLVADLEQGTSRALPVDASAIQELAAHGERVVYLGASAHRPSGVAVVDVPQARQTLLIEALSVALPPAFVSEPQPFSFPTTEGGSAHGFFYAPRNPGAIGPPGSLPPLLVLVHSGPTAAAAPALSPAVFFWTTRGFGVLEVNYRGSTGYGRPYRQALLGQWGQADVEDCVAGALALAAAGKVDGSRMAIRGSSAGGLTVLRALATGRAFCAGASLYGVTDLEALARDTHKFESGYLEGLIGPWPEARAIYQERSPIHRPEALSAPVIFFQGAEDKVVPPDQAERLVSALRARGLETEYHLFPGEQHGFRQAQTIETVFTRELAFYTRLFGLSPA